MLNELFGKVASNRDRNIFNSCNECAHSLSEIVELIDAEVDLAEPEILIATTVSVGEDPCNAMLLSKRADVLEFERYSSCY